MSRKNRRNKVQQATTPAGLLTAETQMKPIAQEMKTPRTSVQLVGAQLVIHLMPWLKLQYMRNSTSVEVFGWGILAGVKGPQAAEVVDFVTVKQISTSTSFEVEPGATMAFMRRMMEQGVDMTQCMRCGIHTHPGNSPQPSSLDEENFEDAHASQGQDWAIMAILAQDNSMYARVRFDIGPGFQQVVPVRVRLPWGALIETNSPVLKLNAAELTAEYAELAAGWKKELEENVRRPAPAVYQSTAQAFAGKNHYAQQTNKEQTNGPVAVGGIASTVGAQQQSGFRGLWNWGNR